MAAQFRDDLPPLIHCAPSVARTSLVRLGFQVDVVVFPRKLPEIPDLVANPAADTVNRWREGTRVFEAS